MPAHIAVVVMCPLIDMAQIAGGAFPLIAQKEHIAGHAFFGGSGVVRGIRKHGGACGGCRRGRAPARNARNLGRNARGLVLNRLRLGKLFFGFGRRFGCPSLLHLGRFGFFGRWDFPRCLGFLRRRVFLDRLFLGFGRAVRGFLRQRLFFAFGRLLSNLLCVRLRHGPGSDGGGGVLGFPTRAGLFRLKGGRVGRRGSEGHARHDQRVRLHRLGGSGGGRRRGGLDAGGRVCAAVFDFKRPMPPVRRFLGEVRGGFRLGLGKFAYGPSQGGFDGRRRRRRAFGEQAGPSFGSAAFRALLFTSAP